METHMAQGRYNHGWARRRSVGINNNSYTNIRTLWVLDHAFKILDILNHDRRDELRARLNINQEELDRLLIKSGYKPDKNFIPKNISHYEKLSSHGSTLSKLVHS